MSRKGSRASSPSCCQATRNDCRGQHAGRGPVERVDATAYTIPTDQPEADGTYAWNSTTIIVVEAHAAGLVGTGWTYGSPVIADVVTTTLARTVVGCPAMATASIWQAMMRSLRNQGRPGLLAMAVSAVDNAVWDLKARLLDIPLHQLLGSSRDRVPVYGSGGFTTYDDDTLAAQLRGWCDEGMSAVKIKIGQSWGSQVDRDLQRAAQAREVVGAHTELFVDANGGYAVGQAVRVGAALDALDVRWFEEPVSSDNLAGLRRVRRRVLADVAAGEYGDGLEYFARFLDADAVDCLQVDVTRCGGVTALYRIGALAQAHHLQVSGHCAPYQHAPVLAALPNLRHLEYFHDHARIERMFFDGTGPVVDGSLTLAQAPGHGLALRRDAAQRYLARDP